MREADDLAEARNVGETRGTPAAFTAPTGHHDPLPGYASTRSEPAGARRSMMVQMTRNAGYDEARATSLTRHRSLDVEGGELSAIGFV
ncbi:MAG: hypothetical protein JWR29_2141 [Tardiphaga sp.]|nr:hypothetical protein [Tardiphaga sp.]